MVYIRADREQPEQRFRRGDRRAASATASPVIRCAPSRRETLMNRLQKKCVVASAGLHLLLALILLVGPAFLALAEQAGQSCRCWISSRSRPSMRLVSGGGNPDAKPPPAARSDAAPRQRPVSPRRRRRRRCKRHRPRTRPRSSAAQAQAGVAGAEPTSASRGSRHRDSRRDQHQQDAKGAQADAHARQTPRRGEERPAAGRARRRSGQRSAARGQHSAATCPAARPSNCKARAAAACPTPTSFRR